MMTAATTTAIPARTDRVQPGKSHHTFGGIMHLITFLAGMLLLAAPAQSEELDAIAAVVNNEAVTCSELTQDMQNKLKQMNQAKNASLPPAAEIKKRSLDSLVIKTLEKQEAAKLEIGISDAELADTIKGIAANNSLLPGQLKEAVEQQGMDFDEYRETLREQMLSNKLINIAVRSKIQVSEEAIREYYRKYLADPKPRREVQLAEIFLTLPGEPSPEQLATVRKKMRDIRQQLVDGSDFNRMVAIYSEAPDRQQQGVMGWFMQGGISQRFSSVLNLPVGGLSDPIRSPSGYHLLKALQERWKDPQTTGVSYDEVHARHILLKVPSFSDDETKNRIRKRAQDIANDLKNASDEQFATRAREESQGPSAKTGGDLGWFKKGAMVPAFEKAAFSLATGQTSGVVESPFGFHIIRLVEKHHIDPNSLAAHHEQIQQILSNIETQEQLPRWLAALKSRADIQTHLCPELSLPADKSQAVQ